MTKRKKQTELNPDDYEPIPMEEFENAVGKVLFAPVNKRDKVKYENRKGNYIRLYASRFINCK